MLIERHTKKYLVLQVKYLPSTSPNKSCELYNINKK